IWHVLELSRSLHWLPAAGIIQGILRVQPVTEWWNRPPSSA
ncbi:hypothetical protein MPH_14115, partial [Macrophomina phaseolina MS6]